MNRRSFFKGTAAVVSVAMLAAKLRFTEPAIKAADIAQARPGWHEFYEKLDDTGHHAHFGTPYEVENSIFNQRYNKLVDAQQGKV